MRVDISTASISKRRALFGAKESDKFRYIMRDCAPDTLWIYPVVEMGSTNAHPHDVFPLNSRVQVSGLFRDLVRSLANNLNKPFGR